MDKVRYAVVGLGYISQAAVLPAFAHAQSNSELVALVSGDPDKLGKLSEQYGVKHCFGYHQYRECLESGLIDAVYIALPNGMHRDFALRAARAGVHVLCEKPMALTTQDCREMIDAARENHIHLMVAYRLHFEKANLSVLEIAKSGQLGDLRSFHSVFSMQVEPQNVRLNRHLTGGPLFDLGIYSINAARNLFRAEPIEVFARSSYNRRDPRFARLGLQDPGVEEMSSAILVFPQDRMATLSASFGQADCSSYELIGTQGSIRVDPAFEMVDTLKYELHIKSKRSKKFFSKRDQFAPELVHFSNCVIQDTYPEPSGFEGLADVRVIQALYHSAETGEAVQLGDFRKTHRLTVKQELTFPPVAKPHLYRARTPSLH